MKYKRLSNLIYRSMRNLRVWIRKHLIQNSQEPLFITIYEPDQNPLQTAQKNRTKSMQKEEKDIELETKRTPKQRKWKKIRILELRTDPTFAVTKSTSSRFAKALYYCYYRLNKMSDRVPAPLIGKLSKYSKRLKAQMPMVSFTDRDSISILSFL